MKLLGLRVDIDTYDGMRLGVPRLVELLRSADVKATFYFSMGPDRSGLAVLNALRPGFIKKMRRTRAARTYGLRTLLSGTLLPARLVALSFPAIARMVRDEGHETGVHAWDHRLWQDRLPRMGYRRLTEQLDKGYAAYETVFGDKPRTFAAPAWLSGEMALHHEESYALDYASDCRGRHPFLPRIGGRTLNTPQVPTTLPTFDEAVGDLCPDASAFFGLVLDTAMSADWPVLTIHAELEGMSQAGEFARFLDKARERSVRCVPLRDLLASRLELGSLPVSGLTYAAVRGRHGVVSMQAA